MWPLPKVARFFIVASERKTKPKKRSIGRRLLSPLKRKKEGQTPRPAHPVQKFESERDAVAQTHALPAGCEPPPPRRSVVNMGTKLEGPRSPCGLGNFPLPTCKGGRQPTRWAHLIIRRTNKFMIGGCGLSFFFRVQCFGEVGGEVCPLFLFTYPHVTYTADACARLLPFPLRCPRPLLLPVRGVI